MSDEGGRVCVCVWVGGGGGGRGVLNFIQHARIFSMSLVVVMTSTTSYHAFCLARSPLDVEDKIKQLVNGFNEKGIIY